MDEHATESRAWSKVAPLPFSLHIFQPAQTTSVCTKVTKVRLQEGIPPNDACQPGFFKAFAGNIKCSKCPPHSHSYGEGAAVCRCELGFFRAAKDPPTMACTRPPSPPRNVLFALNDTCLTLEWSPPSDAGGRRDLTYDVRCQRCGATPEQCRLCEEDLRFLPRPSGLTGASVTVTDFSAHANYTFEIESLNGVSGMSLFPRQVAVITVSTDHRDLV
ncbi:ephrin type-A receptor 6-like [Entelurus aequoreus]|uniref:ephrin type-A receptor 6-like n=1 Tax=Entelurus aequoreus TaxID=161455 RepID=UPI002B1D31FD|nr:ephrin type-A receptor 6-like [Entelurus aequoreus]